MWTATSRIEQLERETANCKPGAISPSVWPNATRAMNNCCACQPDRFGEGADIENSIAAQLVLDSGGPFTRTLVANAGERSRCEVSATSP